MTLYVHEVGLATFNPQQDLERFNTWLHVPHVARWWGDPQQCVTMVMQRPPGTHALITADGRPVGYLCWQKLSWEELEAAALTDLPTGLVDIDILVGELEFLGRGIGPRALALLLEKLRDEGVPFAGLATSTSNRAAIRAFEKCGFRFFREFDDPESGRYIYMATELHHPV